MSHPNSDRVLTITAAHGACSQSETIAPPVGNPYHPRRAPTARTVEFPGGMQKRWNRGRWQYDSRHEALVGCSPSVA